MDKTGCNGNLQRQLLRFHFFLRTSNRVQNQTQVHDSTPTWQHTSGSVQELMKSCLLVNEDQAGPLLKIFQWRGQLRKGTSARKGKVEMCGVRGGGGGGGIFELPRLDFLQFQHDFQTKRDFY